MGSPVVAKAIPQRRSFVPDRTTAGVDQAREDLAHQLSTIPFLRGKLISVNMPAGQYLVVNHALGVPAAFIVIRQNYNANELANHGLFESNPAASGIRVDERQFSILGSDDACTLDLWFYPRASKATEGYTP